MFHIESSLGRDRGGWGRASGREVVHQGRGRTSGGRHRGHQSGIDHKGAAMTRARQLQATWGAEGWVRVSWGAWLAGTQARRARAGRGESGCGGSSWGESRAVRPPLGPGDSGCGEATQG